MRKANPQTEENTRLHSAKHELETCLHMRMSWSRRDACEKLWSFSALLLESLQGAQRQARAQVLHILKILLSLVYSKSIYEAGTDRTMKTPVSPTARGEVENVKGRGGEGDKPGGPRSGRQQRRAWWAGHTVPAQAPGPAGRGTARRLGPGGAEGGTERGQTWEQRALLQPSCHRGGRVAGR